MAKPVRSWLDGLVEENRRPQAAPYMSIVHPICSCARYRTHRSRCKARWDEEHDPHNCFH
jgi:hypothetical protein